MLCWWTVLLHWVCDMLRCYIWVSGSLLLCCYSKMVLQAHISSACFVLRCKVHFLFYSCAMFCFILLCYVKMLWSHDMVPISARVAYSLPMQTFWSHVMSFRCFGMLFYVKYFFCEFCVLRIDIHVLFPYATYMCYAYRPASYAGLQAILACYYYWLLWYAALMCYKYVLFWYTVPRYFAVAFLSYETNATYICDASVLG